MGSTTPRIAAVKAVPPTALDIGWRGSGEVDRIELAGWIAVGRPELKALLRPDVFARAAVAGHGSFVTWDDDTGDLAIDAIHLELIAEQQKAIGAAEIAGWQKRLGLSNVEAASLLGVSPSTWATYKNGTAPVPVSVAIACRSAERDPLVLHAHLRPARPGRMRKAG